MAPLRVTASLVTLLSLGAAVASASPPPSAPSAPLDHCRPPLPGARSITSADAATIVYVQEDPSRHDDSTLGGPIHEDLCVVTPGAAPRLLLAGRSALPDAGVETTLADLDDLRFSVDGTRLYFSSDAWAVGKALHEVELATGAERFVTDGSLDAELATGPYKGKLVVAHFLLDPDHDVMSPKYRGRMLLWYLHTKDGKQLRRLPEDEAARRKVIEGG
jgi:hypothetical protein